MPLFSKVFTRVKQREVALIGESLLCWLDYPYQHGKSFLSSKILLAQLVFLFLAELTRPKTVHFMLIFCS